MQIRLNFPCNIQQVGPREAVVDVSMVEGSILTDKAIDVIAPGLSDFDKDKLHDDITMFAVSEAFKRSITVR